MRAEEEVRGLTGEELRRDLARRMSEAQAAWLREHGARIEVLHKPPYFRVRPARTPREEAGV